MRFRYPSTCGMLLQLTETYLVSRQFCLLQTLRFQWLLQVKTYLKPEHENVPQGTTCIFSGTHSFKSNFQVKTRILKVKSPSDVYTHTHTHIFTVLEIDILLSCVSRASVTVLLHGLVVKRVYHKLCFWGKICISGSKRRLTACSCIHALFSYKVKIRINWCVLCELDWICTETK